MRNAALYLGAGLGGCLVRAGADRVGGSRAGHGPSLGGSGGGARVGLASCPLISGLSSSSSHGRGLRACVCSEGFDYYRLAAMHVLRVSDRNNAETKHTMHCLINDALSKAVLVGQSRAIGF